MSFIDDEPYRSGNFDEELDFSQRMRMRIANNLTAEGIPQEYKTQDILLRTLEGIDRSAMERKKLASDESGNQALGVVVANFLSTLHKQQNSDPLKVEQPVIRELAPKLDALPDEEVTDYMLSQIENHGKTDFDNFTGEFLEKHPEYR